MWKFSVLVVILLLEFTVLSEAMLKNRKIRKKEKAMRETTALANKVTALKKNVTKLQAEMRAMDSSRVMVQVHGSDDYPVETHEGQGGTHVHIHMHLDDQRDHEDHHDDMGDGDHDHSNHGHHGLHMHRGMKMRMKKMKMHEHMHYPTESTYVYGHCEVAMNPTLKKSLHNIRGAIHFRQKMHGPLEMLLHLKGFHVPADAHSDHSMHTHGFHVHQFGDISKGCQSFGGHYNPDGVDHSGKNATDRHAGDWGNIVCDNHGEIHSNMTDSHTSLVGTHSIMGRGIVIHEHQDDLGKGGVAASLKTGNAGGRLACCTVAWAAEHDWATLLRHEDN